LGCANIFGRRSRRGRSQRFFTVLLRLDETILKCAKTLEIASNLYCLGVLNDNNFPFSVGSHGSGKPDDNEFVVIELDTASGKD
jgi:hypothetical protein